MDSRHWTNSNLITCVMRPLFVAMAGRSRSPSADHRFTCHGNWSLMQGAVGDQGFVAVRIAERTRYLCRVLLMLPKSRTGRRRIDRVLYHTSSALGDLCMHSMPLSRMRVQRKFLNPNMGRVRRLIARWSCSTRLLRYLDWRILIGVSRSVLMASSAARLAPLLSMVTVSEHRSARSIS